MTYTLEELKEYIADNVDEVTLIELLGLNSEDLTHYLHDVIEDKYEHLYTQLGLREEENDE